MRSLLLILPLLFASPSFADKAPRAQDDLPALTTVNQVDLSRYVGKWYEIAAIPAIFEFGCVGATATYTARPDGKINVVNQCNFRTFDGRTRVARGVATVEDPQTNAKLSVKFNWMPFTGTYWIIDLDTVGYQYAVVGHPSRKYLWVLSRTPQMDPELYKQILYRLKADKHYDLSKLVPMPQPTVESSTPVPEPTPIDPTPMEPTPPADPTQPEPMPPVLDPTPPGPVPAP